jgi:hypothetical protein|tara:strand:+ start:112 stop:327 length:216 start_codon:yes stop_codon:yes gene_type:complete
LAKEIEDRKNQSIVTDIKNAYNKMYGAYKEEFNSKESKSSKSSFMKCLASELWIKNEQEILKRLVLKQAYT